MVARQLQMSPQGGHLIALGIALSAPKKSEKRWRGKTLELHGLV